MGAVCAKRKIKHIPKGNIENTESNSSDSFSIQEERSNQSQMTNESPDQVILKFPSADCLNIIHQISNKGPQIYKCYSMYQIKICDQQLNKQLTENQDYQYESSQENSDSYSQYGMKKIQYFQNSFSFYSSEKCSRSVISSNYQ